MSIESESLATVREYIDAYNRDVRHAQEQFFADEFEWIEGPTAWFPEGRSGGRRELLQAVSLSESALRDESIEITSTIASGNAVALEGIWRATVTDAGIGIPVGSKLEVPLAQFLRVKGGKIMSSHEYVCAPTVGAA